MPGSKGGGQDLGTVEALGPRPPRASSGEVRACRVGCPFSEAEEEAVCDSQRTSPSQLPQGPLLHVPGVRVGVLSLPLEQVDSFTPGIRI